MAEREPRAAIFWIMAANPLAAQSMVDRLNTEQHDLWKETQDA